MNEVQDRIDLDNKVPSEIKEAFIPTYVPTIEEIFTASGAHRSGRPV